MRPASDRPPALLDWPGKGLPAGWANGWDILQPEPALPLVSTLDGTGNVLALVGDRLAALHQLATARQGRTQLAYADVPRLSSFPVARLGLKLATWLSFLESHFRALLSVLHPRGRLVAQIDDEGAGWVRAVLEDLAPGRHEATILWQKKYSAQQDLAGRVDDGHDFLIVYRAGDDPEPLGAGLDTTWWDYRHAGKAEDSTKVLKGLLKAGTIQAMSKTAKPARLVGRLLEAYTAPAGWVLEAFSETGFATAAAISHNEPRRSALLVGSSEDEKKLYAVIAKPWLASLEGCSIDEAEALSPTARPAAMGPLTPIRYGKPPSRGAGVLADLRPLFAEGGKAEADSYLVRGEVEASVLAARPAIRQQCRAALLDLGPTLDAAGRGRLPAVLAGIAALVAPGGGVVLRVEDAGYCAARLIGERFFGQSQYAGSIVVQGGGSDGAAHACYLLFRPFFDDSPGRMGLFPQRKYSNTDDDPRGDWRSPGYKDARSGSASTGRPYQVPPYRWEIVDRGNLPDEFRLHPATGVLWANRCIWEGDFSFRARIADAAGAVSEKDCRVSVIKGAGALPQGVWWLDKANIKADGLPPRIVSTILPPGRLEEGYGFALRAEGGQPFDRTLLPGDDNGAGGRTRYWPFGPDTLAKRILDNRALFGQNHQAKPCEKKFKSEEDQAGKVQVELSWWDEQRLGDATPEARLLELLTGTGDLVAEAVWRETRFAGEALAMERRVLLFAGDQPPKDEAVAAQCRVLALSPPLARPGPDSLAFRFDYAAERFLEGLCWLEGFHPKAQEKPFGQAYGESLDGTEACVLLGPDDWVTSRLARRIEAELLPRFRRVVVYHFRGWPASRPAPGVVLRRVPFGLSCVRVAAPAAREDEA